MVELQILNRILERKSTSILQDNNITADYFNQYSEEYEYIAEHIAKYGNVPDKETFLSDFPEFDILNVNESDEYLVKTFREEHLYSKSVPIITKLAELLQTDSYEAVDYLKAHIDDLNINTDSIGVDIIKHSEDRFKEWQDTQKNKDVKFIPSGFKEIDDDLGGWHRGEELVVLFARTGQGKSWVIIKMLEHAWKMKMRVGLVEPEMSANKTGFRFDTVHKNISSQALYRGDDIQGYDKYINHLSQSDTPFYVSSLRDFDNKVTVGKLKTWCQNNELDILAIDGISYIKDERMQRGDNKTTQLTNISEDLMQLSIDLGIPILVVVQSNRAGTQNEDLELENIRDSDGIAYNASIVLSIQQKEVGLQIQNVKSRNARVGLKWVYLWDTDKGTFEYIPQPEKGEQDEEKAQELRRRYADVEIRGEEY